ncbi:endonuclease Q family protein [Lacticaseibacillus paracasei]|uniref:endonuclease Q family protein n=1 Tax=Lacticaseibacillus paracasei TaxID=1597 RepID=UPI0021A61AD2|nr:endonuclease Q family protein [Lacticaseibacillus paracasei]
MANNSDKINFCVNCGERLTTQSNFCPKCGKPIKQIKSVSNNASGMRGCKLIPETTFKRGYNE